MLSGKIEYYLQLVVKNAEKLPKQMLLYLSTIVVIHVIILELV